MTSGKRLRWRVTHEDGGFGDVVQFAVDDDTDAYLRDLWARVQAADPGRGRTLLIADLRVQLDLLACGAQPVPPDSGAYRTLSRGR